MAAETPATQAIFKRVYVDPVEKAIPTTSVFRQKIKFDQRNKTGDSYNAAIQLRYPQGWTINGGANLNTDYALNAAVSGTVKQTSVTPFEFTIRQRLPYGLIASSDGKEQAFDETVGLQVASVVEVTDMMLELAMLKGGTYIGKTNTNTATTPNLSCQVSKATFAPGIWAMLEGAYVDAYSDSALTAKLNTNGTVVITSIDITNRLVNMTCSSGADFTAIDTAKLNVYWVPRGAVSNWTDGIDSAITKAAAGSSIYGITASSYALMMANTYDAGAASMTFAKAAGAVINAAVKGGMGDQIVYLSPYSWTDILNDQAGSRRYTQDNGGEFSNGANELTYHGPNGGTISFVMSPMVFAGEAFILNTSDWRRIGSTEPTFNIPGRGTLENPYMLHDVLDANCLEFKRYFEQGVYCKRLARQTKITGIVNSSGPTGAGT